MLSGTPIINDPFEVGIIANLLVGYLDFSLLNFWCDFLLTQNLVARPFTHVFGQCLWSDSNAEQLSSA